MAIMSLLSAFCKLLDLFQPEEQGLACLVLRLVSIKIALEDDPGAAVATAGLLIDELAKASPQVFAIHLVSGLLSRAEMGCRILPEDTRKLSRIVDEIQGQFPHLSQLPLAQNSHDGGIRNARVKLTPTNVLCHVEKTTQFRVYWDDIEPHNILVVLAIIGGTLIGRTGKICFTRNVCETCFYLAEKALVVPELRANHEFPASSRSLQMLTAVPQPKTPWRPNLSFKPFLPAFFSARPPTSKEQPPIKEKSSLETLVEKPVGSENDDKSSDKQG